MTVSTVNEIDLLQAARTEDLVYEQVKQLAVLGKTENSIINTLRQQGAHLLIGARGSGKSMLLRRAEIAMDDDFKQDRLLAVYVNFKTSTILEGVKAGEKNAFQIWVGAKILHATYNKLYFLDLINSKDNNDPYHRIFNISSGENTADFFSDKIHKLQQLAQATEAEKKDLVGAIGDKFLEQALDTSFVLNTMQEVGKFFKLKGVVFLFDEAAHTFIPEQQEVFFEIFKLIHGGEISVKAAVYPTVTSYGRNFEIGQDAIPVYIDRFEAAGPGRAENRKLFRDIVSKRVGSGKVKKTIFAHGELLDLCIDLSTGNPRAFFHLLNKAIDNGFSERAIMLATSSFVDSELLPYHNNLAKRLPKYSAHVRIGIELLRTLIIPEIKAKNSTDKKSGYQSAFFTMPRDISPNLRLMLDLLCYSGILVSKGTVKIAGLKTGQRYMVNLSLLMTEKAFAKPKPIDALSSISLTDYREFSGEDSKMVDFLEKLKTAGAQCLNCGAEIVQSAKFCSNCGSSVSTKSIIGALLEEPVDALSLSDRLKNRVRPKFAKVGNIIHATRDEIMEIKYIKDARSRIIKNAADEFISG